MTASLRLYSHESFRNSKAEKVIGVVEKLRKIPNKTKQKKQGNYNILSYHPHDIEKHNCPGAKELASRERLKSCEIILKAAFLADHEGVECTIDVWVIDQNYLSAS